MMFLLINLVVAGSAWSESRMCATQFWESATVINLEVHSGRIVEWKGQKARSASISGTLSRSFCQELGQVIWHQQVKAQRKLSCKNPIKVENEGKYSFCFSKAEKKPFNDWVSRVRLYFAKK